MKKSIDSTKELTKKDCNAEKYKYQYKKMLPKMLIIIKTTLFAQKYLIFVVQKKKVIIIIKK